MKHLDIASGDAERVVIGGILRDLPDLDLEDLLGRLTPDHFQGSRITRAAFEVIREHFGKRIPTDLLTVSDTLRARGFDPSEATRICGGYIGHASFTNALRIVEETRKRRALAEIGAALVEEAKACDPDEAGATARRGIDALLEAGITGRMSARDVAADLRAVLDADAPSFHPVPTGFPVLDDMLEGGFRPGQLVIVGARSGIGKTALAVNGFALAAAGRGRRVAVVTLEMTSRELGARLVASRTGFGAGAILTGRLASADLPRIRRSLDDIETLPLAIISPRDVRLSAISREVRAAVRRDHAEIVIIDYLQLIRHDRASLPRFEAVGDISATMKRLAVDLGIPLVVLAQLNRQAADAEEPRISHLRESGSIEQDADIVLLLHRPEEPPAALIVAKHRNGSTGRIAVEFIGQRCAYEPITEHRRA